MSKKNEQGLSVKKSENISDWYSEVLQKAELADYSSIKGFMIIRPRAYAIWEVLQENFNSVLKKKKIDNAYFPLLIPESFFKREAEHAEGFAPELAYIANSEEGEKLVIRPTSETVIYDSYSKWIRSWRDLPLKINQWCNVLRWEVKQTKPFLRTREFLWQEGHCAFANEKEALKNMNEIAVEYKKMVEEVLAIPVIIGKKSRMETFAGAKETRTIEAMMPDGKALQCATSHNLGQGFSKGFNVKFKAEDEKEYFVWLTSWGFSTRLIGAMIMLHGDDKGLVLPPNATKQKVVVVPILFDDSRDKVLKKSKEIEKKLKKFGSFVDDRNAYSSGWKFNEWEMKGVPLRIEVGPKDLEKKQVVIVRRDNGKKEFVSEKELDVRIKNILGDMQKDMFDRAKKILESKLESSKDMKDLKKKILAGNIVKVYMKDDKKIEEKLKEETGASSRIIETVNKEGICVVCGEKVNTIAWISKCY